MRGFISVAPATVTLDASCVHLSQWLPGTVVAVRVDEAVAQVPLNAIKLSTDRRLNHAAYGIDAVL